MSGIMSADKGLHVMFWILYIPFRNLCDLLLHQSILDFADYNLNLLIKQQKSPLTSLLLKN